MVFRSEVSDAPEPLGFTDGLVSDIVLGELEEDATEWIRVQGSLANVLLDLARRPEITLVRAGETADAYTHPLYVARAAHQGSIHLGVCGFHLAGARITIDGRQTIASKYQVLVGSRDDFEWRTPSATPGMVPVRGGFLEQDPSNVEPIFISRYRVGNDLVYGSVDVSRAYHGIKPQHVSEYEFLVRLQVPRTQSPDPFDAHDNAQVMVGRFLTENDAAQVKKADRYSKAIYFDTPLKSVPPIITGFDTLSMGNHDKMVRLRLFPQNIMKEHFILNAESWQGTYLYNCGVHWAAISEPTWKCGVLKMKSGSNPWRNRIDFSPAFQSPPMVFACFSSLDMADSFNHRIHVTNVDHTGFNISLVQAREARAFLVSISWIAIPGEDILRRKNAWIGRFSTDSFSADKQGEYTGSVKFGFEFRRNPKIFIGVDHFDFSTDRFVRLAVSTSKVSKTGMDWRLKKWGDSVLNGAGASYLALDCD